MTLDLFEMIYHLSKVPTWIGWSLLTGGFCALAFLLGARIR